MITDLTPEQAEAAEAERHMPPGPRGVVEELRRRGHTVAVRMNRYGSLRYKVDGRAESNAMAMTSRFDRGEWPPSG